MLDFVCRRARFLRHMVCQHLDDACAAPAVGSDALVRFDAAFKENGVELAPRDDHDKSFSPCSAGVVFCVHYDTVVWTWAIPDEKLARTCMLKETAILNDTIPAKDMRSLAGKLLHVKPLVPGGRFNIDKIMRVYKVAAKTEEQHFTSLPQTAEILAPVFASMLRKSRHSTATWRAQQAL